MNKTMLQEYMAPSQDKTIIESIDNPLGGKNWYMKGLFIQGDVRNHNGRIYPLHEIRKAVNTINEQIKNGMSVLGELDHPNDLKINLDRVSHVITEMNIDGANGYGKLKLLPTPTGKLVEAMLSADVKLGVSSRGSGQVNESTGHVSDFEIITVDIVATPSAPNAFPRAIYESLMNMNGGNQMFELARSAANDPRAQKYLQSEIVKFIRDLKLR